MIEKKVTFPERAAQIEWPLGALVVEPPTLRDIARSLIAAASFHLLDPDESGISGFIFGAAVGAVGVVLLVGALNVLIQAASIMS